MLFRILVIGAFLLATNTAPARAQDKYQSLLREAKKLAYRIQRLKDTYLTAITTRTPQRSRSTGTIGKGVAGNRATSGADAYRLSNRRLLNASSNQSRLRNVGESISQIARRSPNQDRVSNSRRVR